MFKELSVAKNCLRPENAPLTILTKSSILDVRQGSEYVSALIHVLKGIQILGAEILYAGFMMVVVSVIPKRRNRVQITLRGF